MSNHDELIAQFIEISGGEESVARFYLSSSNWSLEEALAIFLGNQGENGGSGGVSSGEDEQASQPSGQNKTEDGFGKTATRKPRFATLNDMTQKDSNEEEGQAFYAGGSERSGQQVLGPPKRKNFREQLTEMFRMAHEQSSSEDPSALPSTSSGINWGQGIRLGMTNTDHSIVESLSGNKTNTEKRPIVLLKLWSQGFSIDDGELRLYDDPANKEFLETVMRGEIPQELLQMGWMVNVDVEDHRHEDFKKTSSVQTFRGSGHTLGSPVPKIEENVLTDTQSTAKIKTDAVEDEKKAKENLKINTVEPITTLQIRLSDGSRLTAQFNLTHTIADIHQFIQSARPEYANRNFMLVSSFPTRELTDNDATIDGAGLKNASVMQRLM